jgi:hypothetical protein
VETALGERASAEHDGAGRLAGRVFTPSQLALLAAVQDRLIPPEDDLPGAGEAGAARRVDRYLVDRPVWRPDLLAALQAIEVAAATARPTQLVEQIAEQVTEDRPTGHGAGGEDAFLGLAEEARDGVLRAVEAAQPRLFAHLVRLTYAAYYTDADVQRALGAGAVPPLPRGHTLPAFDESRLEPVRRRGKLWRDA